MTIFSTLTAILWNADPYLFNFGTIKMTWYGAMWGLAILLGYLLAARLYEKEGVSPQYIVKAVKYVFVGGIIGARLGHVLFYDLPYFIVYPHKIFMIWEGGLASHGGAIGIMIAVYLYCRKYKDLHYMQFLDGLAVVIPLCIGLIRIGNLFNSEIIGKPTHVAWAFIFANKDHLPRHPSQLYEAIWAFFLCFFFYHYYIRRHQFQKPRYHRGMLTALFFIIAPSMRFLLEFLKEDAYITQLLNVPLILLGGILLFRSLNGAFDDGRMLNN